MEQPEDQRATAIELFDFRSVPMRTFHITWAAFFLAFFGWFGVAPLMAVVRDDLELTRSQVGNTIIASVAVTVLARLLIGRVADRLGPRRAYSGLLVLGSIPVMGIGLAQNYEAFLLFRLAIGAVGASFVITQHHTSLMFAPNVVGTANATTAGWGNLGGGATQIVMPLVLLAIVSLGISEAVGWRLAMVVPGLMLLAMGLAYARLTQDTPQGNLADLDPQRRAGGVQLEDGSSLLDVIGDRRVWVLFVLYGASFGIELTINNVAALYYHDRFGLSVGLAGVLAGLFGLMNLFARTLGGMSGDAAGLRFGVRGRVLVLGVVLLFEGLALVCFSRMAALSLAVPAMIVFSVLVQMAEGATFAVVPFLNPRALGTVSGIVGAGGNAGAVAAGLLFRMERLAPEDAFLYLGLAVVLASTLIFAFPTRRETREPARRARPAPVPVEGD